MAPTARWRARNDTLIRRYHAEVTGYYRALERRAAPHESPPVPSQARLFPGLGNVLASFATASPVMSPRRARPHVPGREEWNPLSQRLVLQAPHVERRGLKVEFELISEATFNFIYGAHEAMHVVLFEPFFVGALALDHERRFIEYFQAFEGFCFWYGDIVVTRELRTRFPDAELVYYRRGVSDPHFHPYRAFEALGIRDDAQIRDIYLRAFRAKVTPLLHAEDAFSRKLADRVYAFYFAAARAGRAVFRHLRALGIFDQFRARFCCIPGLPALFEPALLAGLERADLAAYCAVVHDDALPRIERYPRARIDAVRVRRMLQTRAFYAWLLEVAFARDLVIAPTLGARAARAIRVQVAGYLERLEALLRALATGVALPALGAKLRANDAWYERTVRRPLRRGDAWVARVETLHPPAPPAGCLAPDGPLTLAALDLHMQRVARSFASERVSRLDPRIAARFAALVALVGSIRSARDLRRRRPELVSHFNAVVSTRPFLEDWSKPLYAIDPLNNSFRDLLFNYR